MSSKNPGRSEVKSRKSPELQDRLDAAAKAKQAMVERFRAKSDAGAAGDKPAAGAAAKKPAAKKGK
ncbi:MULTISPECIES: hypothetical protein [Rhodomicrobium]|uniref:hypothetical protein n=1 Tax=Rhodomicrobium TaxID=1068 RepID=UPI000B4AD1DE|nr:MULTISPECIES: hypothetical protein [Rhodomicrobium]